MDALWTALQAMPEADWRALGLERPRGGETPHFCYPRNARPIGYEGCILYCFLEGRGEMVFAADPESCGADYVFPLAEGLRDFLRLILACGSAGAVEQIGWMDEPMFRRHLEEEAAARPPEQTAALARLGRTWGLSPMEDPFAYVKALQSTFDGSGIDYRDEYDDALGLPRPDGSRSEAEERKSAPAEPVGRA